MQHLILLFVVFVLEYIGVALWFDGQAFLRRTGWHWFTQLHHLPALVFAVGTATLLLQYEQLRNIYQTLAQDLEQASQFQTRRPLWLSLHGLSFVGFVALSYVLFTYGGLPPYQGLFLILLVFAWGAAGVSLLVTLGLAWLPLSAWRTFLSALTRPLLLGSVAGACAWGAGLWGASLLWKPLSDLTLTSCATVLGWVTNPIIYKPETAALGTETFGVFVAPECSGYEGLGLMGVFLGAYLWVRRQTLRFPNALVLLPLGLIAVWALNIVRITSLILIGTWWSPAIAHGGFHSKAGWILFCLVALVLVFASQRLSFFTKKLSRPDRKENATEEEYWNPTAAYLMPLMSVLATSLVVGLFLTGSFDRFYGVRVLVACIVLWMYRSYFRELWQQPSVRSLVIGTLVFGLWMLLISPPQLSDQKVWLGGFQQLSQPELSFWLLLRIFGGVLTVPIVEELAFRGFLLRRIMHSDFTEVSPQTFHPLSWVVSSLVFGALHQAWLAGTLAGLLYAYAYYYRGRLSDAIVAHIVTNGWIAIYVFWRQAWWLWM